MFVISASATVGYRTDEDSKERYHHVISGQGFSPLDVDQQIFDDPEGNKCCKITMANLPFQP